MNYCVVYEDSLLVPATHVSGLSHDYTGEYMTPTLVFTYNLHKYPANILDKIVIFGHATR